MKLLLKSTVEFAVEVVEVGVVVYVSVGVVVVVVVVVVIVDGLDGLFVIVGESSVIKKCQVLTCRRRK